LLGRTRAELIGNSFRYCVAGDNLLKFNAFLSYVMKSDQTQTTEVRLKQSARCLRLEATSFTNADGSRLCRIAAIDTTAVSEAENKLQAAYQHLEERVRERTNELDQARDESERRAAQLQSVLASIIDGVMLLDAEGHVTYVNDACIRIFEAPGDEAFDDWHSRIKRYYLDGTPIAWEESATYRAVHGETVQNFHTKTVTPWGKEVILELTASPIRDANGALFGVALVFRDIAGRIEWERQREALLQREQHISEVLKDALIPPQKNYRFNRCRVAVKYEAASDEASIGGDFYDVFQLGDGKVGIVIGDITGKGLQAAFRVGAIRHSIRSYAYLDPSPARVMTLVNEAMCKEQEDGMEMLTAFFGVIDTATGEIIFTSAGHEPPFLRHTDGIVTELNEYDRALGMTPGHDYSQARYQMQQGDLLVIITDGITEAVSADRQAFFDREGIIGYLERTTFEDPSEIADGLLGAAAKFAEPFGLRDDAAIIVVKFNQ